MYHTFKVVNECWIIYIYIYEFILKWLKLFTFKNFNTCVQIISNILTPGETAQYLSVNPPQYLIIANTLLCIFYICILISKCILSEHFQNQLEKIWHFIFKYSWHASLKNQDSLHVIWTIVIPKKIIKTHIFIHIPPVIYLLFFITDFCFSLVSYFNQDAINCSALYLVIRNVLSPLI